MARVTLHASGAGWEPLRTSSALWPIVTRDPAVAPPGCRRRHSAPIFDKPGAEWLGRSSRSHRGLVSAPMLIARRIAKCLETAELLRFR